MLFAEREEKEITYWRFIFYFLTGRMVRICRLAAVFTSVYLWTEVNDHPPSSNSSAVVGLLDGNYR